MERARSRALLGALAAELGHELQGPSNLFRLVMERVEQGHAIDADDAASMREELARMSRLVTRLRKLAGASLVRRPTTVQGLVELALDAAGVTRASGLAWELGEAASREVVCESELASVALAELLTNAMEARRDRAGVRVSLAEGAGLCVWDDGPGFAIPFEQALSWGASTRAGRAGLGLTLAQRAARAHGFALTARREGDFTEVWLSIPDLGRPSGPKEPP